MATVRLEGVDNILAELRKRGIKLTDGLEQITTAGALVIEKAASANASAISDTIANNIEHKTLSKGKRGVVVGVAPTRRAWFAPFVEDGTANHSIEPRNQKALKLEGGNIVKRVGNNPGISPHPFMRPAVDENGQEVQAAMGDETKRVLGL